MTKLTLYHGDALKILPTLPDESIDLVLTDPPYNILNTVQKISKTTKKWDNFGEQEFFNFSLTWIRESERILKDGGSLIFFWSERHLWLVKDLLDQTNLKLHKILIWNYPNVLKGFSNKRWINTFDFIFHVVKGNKPKTFHASFVKSENVDVFRFPKPQYNFKHDHMYHPTQKPLDLIKILISNLTDEGDTVLDPFIGSGTTMVASKELNRNAIGIEKEAEYIKIIKDRLNWGSSLGDVEFEFIGDDAE